ncbi:MAG: Nramp family divalent metal transporter [Bdellovibrionales bacterium]
MHSVSPRINKAPFCPNEIRGVMIVDPNAAFGKKLWRFLGPGMLVAVGYMDPGNWATDIQAGSAFGYSLLSVILFSSLTAILLQYLAARLGIVSGKDLARLSRDHHPKPVRFFLWFLAEIAIIACDLAEVLGCALAFHLLLGVPVIWGVVLTILDTVIILGLQGRNFRTLEAIVLGLIATIAICFFTELVIVRPLWPEVLEGFKPPLHLLENGNAVMLAVGIVGATVMPHNIYLHSSVVNTRRMGVTRKIKKETIRFATIDAVLCLAFAFLINCAILILASAAFHASGHRVTEIQDAYMLLNPVVGSALAAPLFGLALLAAGQSSTFTGTVAGQVIMDGFLNIKIPVWQRRLITRSLALIPALLGISYAGEQAIGTMLVLSQVVLSLQLPFAVFPLLRFSGRADVTKNMQAPRKFLVLAWMAFAVIVSGNVWMLVSLLK